MLAGSAEGFALLPALRPRLAAVLHPGFTEPEAALRAAGVPVRAGAHRRRRRPPAAPGRGAGRRRPRGGRQPDQPDRRAAPGRRGPGAGAPGRVLLVDEAFADAVPGEPESLAGDRRAGLLVFRSLTKTWALAGLRAGLRPRRARSCWPGWPRRARRGRSRRPRWRRCSPAASPPPWPRPAGPRARLAGWRGRPGGRAGRAARASTVLPGRAPYLLLRLPAGRGERVRAALRAPGYRGPPRRHVPRPGTRPHPGGRARPGPGRAGSPRRWPARSPGSPA